MDARARLRSSPGAHAADGGGLAHFSDRALVALIQRQDEAAFAELYDRHGGAAYRLATRVIRDRALAEDAVQDAFFDFWRTARTFRPDRAKVRTWILTLVHRRAVDVVRREQRRQTTPIELATPTPLSSPAAADQADLRERRQTVQNALRQLSDREREALELAYYGGYTQNQIAERLAEPLGTIKARMFTGLRRLRDLLADSDLAH